MVGVSGNGRVELQSLLLELRRAAERLTEDKDRPERATRTEVLKQLAELEGQAHDPGQYEDVVRALVPLCLRARLNAVLDGFGIRHPAYNYFEPFEENVAGPRGVPKTLARPGGTRWRLLGQNVAFPIGMPASVLMTTARWIEFYAKRGFNILTYKTVRSRSWPAHAYPNWVFLKDREQPLSPRLNEQPDVEGDLGVFPQDPSAFSMANSFGVPSFERERWQEDVREALRCLRTGQLLIVSVMGSPEECETSEKLALDFVQVAKDAEATGATAIELNLSCPNTIDPVTKRAMPAICIDAEATQRIVRSVREAINGKLVIKMSHMPREGIERVLKPLLSENPPLVDAVSGINTLQLNVRQVGGEQVFPGAGRLMAGVSGAAIREYGLDFVRSLAAIREDAGVHFDIIGMGGVMRPEHVRQYLNRGANAVQAATVAFFNPDFALKVQELEVEREARARALGLLTEGPKAYAELVAAVGEIFVPSPLDLAARAEAVLEHLEHEHKIEPFSSGGLRMYRAADRAGAAEVAEL